MSRVEAAAAMDRLPWLSDEPDPQPAIRRSEAMIGGAAAAILLFAGAGYWMGTNSVEDVPGTKRLPSTTVRLPEARPAPPAQPQVRLSRAPEVEPIVAPPMPVVSPPAAAKSASGEPEQGGELQPWPVRIIAGASGRLVRVGAYSTSHRAKRGWWAIVRKNPALERLPALVVPVRSLRSGRVYYRLQMGTTSQAHSAVLCQRLRMSGQSCVVLGV